jgi:Mn-dependent DtxR family transcriptional regulator
MKAFSEKQGQYLAFIYYYEKLNGRPPSEADMANYFRVSPPSVHDMVLRLEAGGFIARTPGKARSIRLLVPGAALPNLK